MIQKEQQTGQARELLRTDRMVFYRDGDIPCIKDGGMIAEERQTRLCGQNVLSLIKNTMPMSLRREEYKDGSSVLLAEHYRECSWFAWNDPQEGKDYDSRCPKVAWGIVAYLGYWCWIDEDGELDWDGGCTLGQMFARYHDEALMLYRLTNKAYCKAVRHNDATMLQTLEAVLEDGHSKDEAVYVEQSKESADVLGKPIFVTAQKYLAWLQARQAQHKTDDAQQATPCTQQPTGGVPVGGSAVAHIPTINGTEAERKVFGMALQKGYMELVDGKYKWNKSKSLLAYMCGRLYCGDRIERVRNEDVLRRGMSGFPQYECMELFGCDVASYRHQQHNKGTIPNRFQLINAMFEDAK